MLHLLFSNRRRPASAPTERNPYPSPARLALLDPGPLLQRHDNVLQAIRRHVGVPIAHWQALYEPLLQRYAAFVQLLPASEAHHHADAGGLLRHGLETAEKALTLRRGRLLPPGAAAEDLAAQQDLWTYATTSGALLHDLGKPVSDQQIRMFDESGQPLGIWNPILAPMRAPAATYEVTYVRGRRYRIHQRVPPLLAHLIVPEEGLRWLASDIDVFEAWLATISGGDSEFAGVLGEMIRAADGVSVASDLTGLSPATPVAQTVRSLVERLATGLRHLVDQGLLPLNRPGAAGFVVGDDLWLVAKRVLDALREHLLSEGQGGIPNRNDRLMDELQQHGLLMPNADKAVWLIDIELGSWRQQLSVLRIPMARVWADPAARPQACDGRISAITAPPGSVEPGTTDALSAASSSAKHPSAQVVGLHAEEITTHSSVSGTDIHGLPLPPMAGLDWEEQRISTTSAESIVPTLAAHAYGTAPSAIAAPSPEETRAAPTPATEQAVPANSDSEFLAWLRAGLTSAKIKINVHDALVHVVDGGLLIVSPKAFREYAGLESWNNAQKQFLKLKLHTKHPNSTNIWSYRVVGERKQGAILKGILLPAAEDLLQLPLPPVNTHLHLVQHTEDKA